MQFSTKIAALMACFVLAVAVIELVRKKRIREEYSLMWLALTFAFAAGIIFDRFASNLLSLAGGVNLSSLFFFGGVFFSVLMLLHLTVVISDLRRKQNVLIQEAGLLAERLERLGQVPQRPRPMGPASADGEEAS
jgi:hypothetical protein